MSRFVVCDRRKVQEGVTPCRKSNQQVRRHVTKHDTVQSTPAAPAPSESVNGALLSLLEKYMFQNGHAPLGGEELDSHRASFGRSPLVGERHSPRGSSLASSSPSSVATGSSPAPLFSGGIEPGCLDPCHDKLAKLKAKLCCAEEVSDFPPLEDGKLEEGVALELPRLSKQNAHSLHGSKKRQRKRQRPKRRQRQRVTRMRSL